MEEEELISQRTKGKKCSCSCTSCECNIVLPQPKRPFYPVDSGKYELLECFPCYFQATWILDKFPFLRWLLSYKLKWLISDVIAGLTVGLMVVPQALAYARIANLPPSVRLTSGVIDKFVRLGSKCKLPYLLYYRLLVCGNSSICTKLPSILCLLVLLLALNYNIIG